MKWLRFFRKKDDARPEQVSGQKQFATGGFQLKGTLTFPSGGSLACPLEGDLFGEAHTVVAPSGILRGDAWAASLAVEGSTEGRLYVRRQLHVAKDARVRGKCLAGSLSAEDGSLLNAEIELRPDADNSRPKQGRAAS